MEYKKEQKSIEELVKERVEERKNQSLDDYTKDRDFKLKMVAEIIKQKINFAYHEKCVFVKNKIKTEQKIIADLESKLLASKFELEKLKSINLDFNDFANNYLNDFLGKYNNDVNPAYLADDDKFFDNLEKPIEI